MSENSCFDNDPSLEKIINTPLYIGRSEVGSAPHIPEIDAPSIMEMNADPRITQRFGENERNLNDTIEALDPSKDLQICKDLLDPTISYDDSSVLERRIQINIATNETTQRNMIGWVAFYRSFPKRIERFFDEGLLERESYNVKKFPVLEISYAKAKDAPSGVLIEGIQAEIYRLYETAINSQYDGKSLIETGQENMKTDLKMGDTDTAPNLSYNMICPVRIIATIDTDNIGSAVLAERLGFVKKGETTFETRDEADDPAQANTKIDHLYELDWDLFMRGVNNRVEGALPGLQQ